MDGGGGLGLGGPGSYPPTLPPFLLSLGGTGSYPLPPPPPLLPPLLLLLLLLRDPGRGGGDNAGLGLVGRLSRDPAPAP